MRGVVDRWIAANEVRLAGANRGLKYADAVEFGLGLLANAAAVGGMAELAAYAAQHISGSAAFFAVPQTPEFRESGGLLAFDTPLPSGSPANDQVEARFYPARGHRAVLLLGHWNSSRASYAGLGRALAAAGIACLHLSLPYHDGRETPGVGYAREMASENLGLTVRAHRQAIVDARAALSWLERRGYARIGLIGFSLGSSIASIVAAHDASVAALALVLMADDLAEVIWTGSATAHLRRVLEERCTLAELKSAWSVISPNSYAPLLATRLDCVKIVVARLDSVFLPELTTRYVDRLTGLGMRVELDRVACGHYSLGLFPFNLWCWFRLQRFLWRRLR
jgi:pimeloyl-ACP methyl ester carboxylesterase